VAKDKPSHTEALKHKRLRRRRGYALGSIVLIAIAAIILLLIANVIGPDKKERNESSTISMLRAIDAAQEIYKSRKGWYLDLEKLVDERLLGEEVLKDDVNGYRFTDWVQSGQLEWSVTAIPVEPGISGDYSYFINVCGVIRYKRCTSIKDAPADDRSSPLNP
jgi:type II secretory pathway pseudopilin PulG